MRRVKSKPFIGSVVWMKTATLSCVPVVPVRVGALVGQLVVPGVTMQTVPVAACAGIAIEGK